MLESLIVGNPTIDIIVLESGERFETLGGGSVYASLTMARLGFRSAIVGRAGRDLEEYLKLLEHKRLNRKNLLLDAERTTRFLNDYSSGGTKRFLLEDSGAIDPEKIVYRRSLSAIFNPVFREISPDLISKVDACLKFLDVQGLLRYTGEGGEIILRRNETCLEALSKVNACKLSIEEARVLIGKDLSPPELLDEMRSLGPRLVAITMGREGALIGNSRKTLLVRTEARRVVDETGAGDVFGAGLVAGLMLYRDLEDSARLASAVASLCVEARGTQFQLERSEVLEALKRTELREI